MIDYGTFMKFSQIRKIMHIMLYIIEIRRSLVESYCNMNASGRENYRNCSDQSNRSQMNFIRNNETCKREVQTGICNRTVQSQNRMVQQCRREDRMQQQCKREAQQCGREDAMMRQCRKDDRTQPCSRNVEVECVCKVKEKEDCGKQDDMEALGYGFPVVMAYVPWQQWGDMYEAECGLMQGTIFKDLNLIFCGERC